MSYSVGYSPSLYSAYPSLSSTETSPTSALNSYNASPSGSGSTGGLSGLPAATTATNPMLMLMQIMEMVISLLGQMMGGLSSPIANGLGNTDLAANPGTSGTTGTSGASGNAGNAENASNAGGAGNAGNADNTSTPVPSPTPAATGADAQVQDNGVASLGTDAQTQGNKIVLSNGQNFDVHGIDIGGDLVPEDWMDGTQSGLGNNGRSGYQVLVDRFGQEQANKLVSERENNWITPSDMQNIKSMGYNTIRVPFSEQNFPKNADGSYDFSAMDHIVNEAAAAGLHVIPDFHVWKGQDQNYQEISGDSAQGAQERQDSSKLLQAFAQHYKGNGTIVAIDEDNEATGSPNDQLQKDLYNAIRQGDSNRAVMIESVSYGNFDQDGFKNAIYSDHYPPLDSNGLSNYINQFSDAARPVVIGEMHGDPEQVGPAVKQLNAAGIGWMNWTYKGVNVGNWALENLPASSLDLQNASYEEIQQAWSKEALQATTPNTDLINAYKQGM